MKSQLTMVIVALTALCALAACTKDGLTKDTPKKTTIDSTSVALALTAGIWVLNKVEYPKTATSWAVAYDSGSLGFSTLSMHSDHTLAFASHNVVTNTGTWSLSKDKPLLTLSYAGQTEVDTLGAVNATTLQLTIPKQISVNINFYEYYRDTYVLRK
jgi:hypothetical protein